MVAYSEPLEISSARRVFRAGHERSLDLCCPEQLTHLASFAQFLSGACVSLQFTQRLFCRHTLATWPKFWQLKHWTGPRTQLSALLESVWNRRNKVPRYREVTRLQGSCVRSIIHSKSKYSPTSVHFFYGPSTSFESLEHFSVHVSTQEKQPGPQE